MFKKINRKNKKGFTLAELLIVVAIIGVLVAVSIPIFTSQLEKSREAVDAARMAAISSNLTDFFGNLGDIGREATFRKWVNENPAILYTIGNEGIGYKGIRGAKGGYLTIKRGRK